jgi:hypothetical protein
LFNTDGLAADYVCKEKLKMIITVYSQDVNKIMKSKYSGAGCTEPC